MLLLLGTFWFHDTERISSRKRSERRENRGGVGEGGGGKSVGVQEGVGGCGGSGTL